MDKFCYSPTKVKKLKNYDALTFGQKAHLLTKLIKHKNYMHTIPKFGVISTSYYLTTLSYIQNEVKEIDKIYNILTEDKLTKLLTHVSQQLQIKQCIQQIFSQLNLNSNLGIAIRPSATLLKQHNPELLSGLFPTYLNIKTPEETLLAIKNIIKFSLSAQTVDYLHINNLSVRDIGIAFMLQQMIVPETSGIAYPYNPVTQNPHQITIEAVYGLGNSLANGEIIPDTYLLDAYTFSIIEKRISPQTWMYIPQQSIHTIQQTQKVKLSPMMQYAQKVDDLLLAKIAQLTKQLNKNQKHYILLEWATIGNNIYILQTKKLQPKLNQKTAKAHNTAKTFKPTNTTNYENTPLIQGTPLAQGTTTASVINLATLNNQNMQDLQLPKKDFIIVANSLSKQELLQLAQNPHCKGFIFDLVPPNSDIAFLLQQQKIPSIGNTFNATKILQNNMVIKLDATSGTVFYVQTKKNKTTQLNNEHATQQTHYDSTKNNNQSTTQHNTHNTLQNSKQPNTILTIYYKISDGIYTDKNTSNKKNIYVIPIVSDTTFTQYVSQNTDRQHILLAPIDTPKKLINTYLKAKKLSAHIYTGYIINDFSEFSHAISNLLNQSTTSNDIYLLINLQQLYETTYKDKNNWLNNKDFLQFIQPLFEQFKKDPNIKLFYYLSKHKKLTQKLSTQLQTLGFVGILKD